MKKKSNTTGNIINNILLVFIGLVTLYPFIYVLSTSISSSDALVNGRVFLLPKGFSLSAFKRMLDDKNLWMGFKNSVIYTFIGTICCVAATLITAYPLAQKNGFEKYSKPFMKMVIFTMYFSGGMIPTFLLVKNLGMLDTFWSIFVPSIITPFQLIIAKTFIEGIPTSICESAKIDGANEIQIFARIIVPLSLPIIAVLCLYNLTGVWNEFRAPMLYINSQDKYPLQVFVREIVLKAQMIDRGMFDKNSGFNSETIKAATLVVTTIPVLIVYPLIQRYLVSGITVGAVKE